MGDQRLAAPPTSLQCHPTVQGSGHVAGRGVARGGDKQLAVFQTKPSALPRVGEVHKSEHLWHSLQLQQEFRAEPQFQLGSANPAEEGDLEQAGDPGLGRTPTFSAAGATNATLTGGKARLSSRTKQQNGGRRSSAVKTRHRVLYGRARDALPSGRLGGQRPFPPRPAMAVQRAGDLP